MESVPPRELCRPLLHHGVPGPVHLFAEEVAVLQAADEPGGLLCHHPFHPGPRDRGTAGNQ